MHYLSHTRTRLVQLKIASLILNKFYSNLAFRISQQLSCCADNRILARLFDLALEDDLVALAPHLRHDSLTGIDSSSKTDLDILDWAVPRKIRLKYSRKSL